MIDEAPEISVDLAEMKQIGKWHLPALANHHNAAAESLNEVEIDLSKLFETPGSGESGVQSVAYEKWLSLYTLTQKIMQDTVLNLTDTGKALSDTADTFAQTDLTNAERLAYEEEMKTFQHGDEEYRETDGEHGEGPVGGDPPPKPDDPPKPKDTPDDDDIYTVDDGAGVDDADL